MAAVLEIAGESGQREGGSFTAIAYVDTYAEGGGHMKFAENVVA